MKLRLGHAPRLFIAQYRAGFDEMHFGREPGAAHGAQSIGGQRAAPRAQLDIDRLAGLAGAQPDIGEAQADKFPEHLADFRRGDEVSACA